MVSQHIIGNCCGNTPSIARSLLQWTSRSCFQKHSESLLRYERCQQGAFLNEVLRDVEEHGADMSGLNGQNHFETPNTCSELK